MKRIVLLSLVVCLAGCHARQATEPQPLYEMNLEDQVALEGTCAPSEFCIDSNTADAVVVDNTPDNQETANTTEEVDNSELEYVNSRGADDLFIFRDKKYGCEYIEVDTQNGVAITERKDSSHNPVCHKTK